MADISWSFNQMIFTEKNYLCEVDELLEEVTIQLTKPKLKP